MKNLKAIRELSQLVRAYRSGQMDKRIIKKFLLIVIPVTSTYLLIACVVTISLLAGANASYSLNNPYAPVFVPSTSPLANGNERDPSVVLAEDKDNTLLAGTSRTNVLILGIDEINLADVVIVGSIAWETGDVNLLHIPRDTFTQVPEERINRMRDNGLWFPASGIVNINAMRSLGRQFGVQYMQEQLSETLGIELHYYVEVSLVAFREVVDLLGGVEIEVPRRMFYHDPYQNLLIDIPAGTQILDGHMAEGFVRYRGYGDGDIGRISAQQQFMTQLFRQSLRRESIMSDPIGMARIALQHVQTDIGLGLFQYVPYIGNLSPDRIFTYTLPGQERRIHGSSFWVPDADRVPEIINRMFFGVVDEEEEHETLTVATFPRASLNAQIAVFNGTRIGGLATSVADSLHSSGYHVAHVGVYSGTQENRTHINVRNEGLGEDLMAYFENAIIRVDPEMSSDFDIVIIVGHSER